MERYSQFRDKGAFDDTPLRLLESSMYSYVPFPRRLF